LPHAATSSAIAMSIGRGRRHDGGLDTRLLGPRRDGVDHQYAIAVNLVNP